MRRVLVCGGRWWSDRSYLYAVLNSLHAAEAFTIVIEGEAPGADTMGREWAIENNVPYVPYPAYWKKFGAGAGPIRNQQMLAEGKPTEVVAFHENLSKSRGTKHMVDIATKAGVKVSVFPPQDKPETISEQLDLF